MVTPRRRPPAHVLSPANLKDRNTTKEEIKSTIELYFLIGQVNKKYLHSHALPIKGFLVNKCDCNKHTRLQMEKYWHPIRWRGKLHRQVKLLF